MTTPTPDHVTAELPFVVRLFEGTPWVPLHEAARLHDAVQKSGLTIAALRNELAITAELARLGAAWQQAEAALPEGWSGPVVDRIVIAGIIEVIASASSTRSVVPELVEVCGPTPAAALTALAAALRGRTTP